MKLLDGFKFLLNPSWLVNNFFTLWGGDGGGSSAPSQTTVQNTNIPDYAQPYVENMLGATQQQLFNTTKDKNGNVTLTGLKPYQPYSTNAQDYVAGFSPMQQQAQAGANALRLPGQIGVGSRMASQGGIGSLGAANQAMGTGQNYFNMAGNSAMTQSLMNPYLNASLAPQLQLLNQQFGQQNANLQGQATGAGAFGGSREALMEGLNQQNQNLAQQQAIAQGYNTAFNQAQQEEQFGAGLGLQGLQAGLQGYGQAIGAGQTLGQLGQEQLAGQQNILNQQNQFGAQQQAMQQQMINQQIQNYANAQQYPLMELGTMSNMLRGLPMQASTTQTYNAVGNPLTQGIGMAGAFGSLYGANNVGKKEGGKVEAMAKGGIAAYGIGGATEGLDARLETMYDTDPDSFKKELQSPSQMIREEAQKIQKEKQMGLASGGVVAFKDGNVTDSDVASAKYDAWQAGVDPAVETGLKALFPPSLMVTDNPIKAGIKDALRYPFKGGVAGVDENDKVVTREEKYGKTPYLDEYFKNREANIAEKNANVQNLQEQAANQKAINTQKDNLTGSPVPSDAVNTSGNPLQYNYNDPTASLINTASPSVQPGLAATNQPQPQPKPATTVDQGQETGTGQSGVSGYQSFINSLPKNVKEEMNKSTQDRLDEEAAYTMKVSPMAQKIIDRYQKQIDDADNDSKRRMYLHAAAAFAQMATIPGPTAYAAMSALKDQIPLYIKDEDEAKKAINEVSKSQADILEAEQRARSGQWEAAAKQRQDAVMKPLDLYMKFLEANKPSSEERIIDKAMKDPKYLETLQITKGTGAEARKYASDESLYKAAIASGKISDVPGDPNYTSFDDYRSGSVHGKNKYAGFKDLTNQGS